ncbi:fibrous sheath-interacting protein 1-like [Hydractinia symbiolongicarpus]|uniref:fibrous sheath-interacting protein 1-like n=1 Tax=Hydractinia symbiolongicarpus TaxID=13093 RepID=UPI00254F6F19|nr:fibrous sheath-interacting protein 1-like [Hydractinia symbiolongicarpus]
MVKLANTKIRILLAKFCLKYKKTANLTSQPHHSFVQNIKGIYPVAQRDVQSKLTLFMAFNSGSPHSRPGSSSSRSSSIVRSCRDSFVSELEYLPPEDVTTKPFKYSEEVLDVVDMDEYEESSDEVLQSKCIEGNLNEKNLVSETETESNDTNENTESKEVDRRVKRGLKKIQKLDKVLAEKLEEEREVKKERRALEKEFQTQVQELLKEKGSEKICGSQQLLSLCSSTDRPDIIEENIASIFTTQLNAEYYQDERKLPQQKNDLKGEDPREGTPDKKDKKKTRDFIKRNIQLASQANELIQLTEEERKRLDELLADDSDLLLVDNPFTVPSLSISGFQFSKEEQTALESIDTKLKEYLPDEDYRFAILDEELSDDVSIIAESVRTETLRNDLCENNEVNCGERVLQDEQNERSMLSRLNDIEARLKSLRLEEDDNHANIDPELLRRLLDVDSRLTSSSTSICDSLRSGSTFLHDVDICSVSSQSVTGLDTRRTPVTIT